MANLYDNVPAPTDANGRVVPLDTKELVLEDGKVVEVGGLEYRNAECSWVADLVGLASKVPLNSCTLPDSWEKLERDVMDTRDVKWYLVSCRYYRHDTEDSCVGCPARSEDNCENSVLVDLVRRAKALAGVADDE